MHAPHSSEPIAPSVQEHPGSGPIEVWPVGNRVGESPAWHAGEQALYWIDVRGQQVLRLEPARQRLTRWQLPEVVGALALWGDGTVRLALRKHIVDLDLQTGLLRTVCSLAPHEPPGNRLNDGKRSPSGRWFIVGSMDDRQDKQASGGLYCVSNGGAVRQLHAGLVVANGIAWSPDAHTLYFSDSFRGQVWQAAWNEAEGTMGEPRPFADLGEAEGRPDGAQVDGAGRYWSAGVSAGAINILAASGERQDRIALPCRAPTMCAFGPAGDLWVTSLVRPGWEPTAHDGALLRLQVSR
ncbi:MAG: SMP-30/gluconolactonase/LRE family protein [Pseudomonadota bacterium]